MNTIIKIAWRNIWRNKRRTLITIASIMFALFFAIIMRGFQVGSYAKMKENAIESYSGYIQIQKKGYWEDKNINNVFAFDNQKEDAYFLFSPFQNSISYNHHNHDFLIQSTHHVLLLIA